MPRVKIGPALPDRTTIDVEIARLRNLDVRQLQSRWYNVFGRRPHPNLPRHLLFRVLAYRLQADHLGDLDGECQRLLDRSVGGVSAWTRWEYGYSGKFTVATLFANQLGAVDILVMSVLFSSETVGDYAIASRIAALFTFFQLAMLKRFCTSWPPVLPGTMHRTPQTGRPNSRRCASTEKETPAHRERSGRRTPAKRNPAQCRRPYTSSLRSRIATRNCQPSKLISMRPNSSHDTS